MADIFSFDDEVADRVRRLSLGEEESEFAEAEGDDTLSDLPVPTTKPIPIKAWASTAAATTTTAATTATTATTMNVYGSDDYGVSPSQGRLGSSYEVDIDKNYVSSFAPSDMGYRPKKKMTPLDFEPLKVLGEGTYGKVFLVKHRATGKLFAQKQLKKATMVVEMKKIEQTKTERSILESVRHPYIVRLFYALQDVQKLYLILEYAQGGELFTHLAMERMFSEDVASFYVAEMALALHHLHANVGVVYRDLKPENCLLDADGHLLLTDFGLSKVATDDESCKTFLGTPEYMAPETLEGKEYDYAVDWWSLGAVCYDLLTGNPPFRGNNYQKIIEKIKKTKLNLPYYLSADAKDILTRLLRRDPRKRLGYKDLAVIKKHRFFRKLDWAKLEARDPSIVPPIVPVITDPELAENFSSGFTDRPVTPEDGVSIPIPTPDVLHEFTGFSFTASQSFIDGADLPVASGFKASVT